MITALQAASYIYFRYGKEQSSDLDEMKLHKLLYYAQRECLIQTEQPMFPELFEAWKYGPVMACLRDAFRRHELDDIPTEKELEPYRGVFDYVFATYASRSSWSLSMMTHGESCWQKAREGYRDDQACTKAIPTEDIAKDAEYMKMRRFYFEEILPKLKAMR